MVTAGVGILLISLLSVSALLPPLMAQNVTIKSTVARLKATVGDGATHLAIEHLRPECRFRKTSFLLAKVWHTNLQDLPEQTRMLVAVDLQPQGARRKMTLHNQLPMRRRNPVVPDFRLRPKEGHTPSSTED
jgi:hypothetical protein